MKWSNRLIWSAETRGDTWFTEWEEAGLNTPRIMLWWWISLSDSWWMLSFIHFLKCRNWNTAGISYFGLRIIHRIRWIPDLELNNWNWSMEWIIFYRHFHFNFGSMWFSMTGISISILDVILNDSDFHTILGWDFEVSINIKYIPFWFGMFSVISWIKSKFQEQISDRWLLRRSWFSSTILDFIRPWCPLLYLSGIFI